MHRTLLILSLFGILFLTNCGGTPDIPVTDAEGRTVGHIRVDNKDNATILSVSNEERGRVRGNLVRDDSGGRAGTVQLRDVHVVLVDDKGGDIGSVEKGTDCYGKSQTLLGKIPAETDPEFGGAACMLLLLPKQ